MKGPIFILCITLFLAGLAAGAYVIQPGDVLTRVVRKHLGKPVYGKKGTLSKVLAKNPNITNPNLVFPGQIIELNLNPRTLATSEPTGQAPTNQTLPEVAPSISAEPQVNPKTEPPALVDTAPVGPQAHKTMPIAEKVKPTSESTGDSKIATAPHELNLILHTNYGPTLLNFQQGGAFGSASGLVLATNTLQLKAGVTYDVWRFQTVLESYALAFGTNTTDPSQSQNKSIQTFAVEAGYGVFTLGAQARTFPVLLVSGTNTLTWGTLTTVSPLAGLHFEKEWISPKRRKFAAFGDIKGSIPMSGSGGTGGPSVSNLSGFNLGANLGARKTLFESTLCKMDLGLEFDANYTQLSYMGSWNTNSGSVTHTFQEYSTKLGVDFEF